MSVTVDTLLTVYALTDRYTGQAARIAASTDTIGEKVERTLALVGRLSGFLTVTATVALAKFAEESVKTAANVEELNKQLTFLTGSQRLATDKIDFLERLAKSTKFTFGDLEKAGVASEKVGLNLQAALLTMTKLASFPGSGGLEAATSLIERLAEGNFPRALSLAGFGLRKEDFEQQGIEFDKGGKLISSAEQVFAALQRIVDQKYGGILDDMQNTTAVKLNGTAERFREIMEKIGASIEKFVLPALDRLNRFLENLNKSDAFDKWLQHIGKNFILFVGVVIGGVGALLMALGLLRAATGDVAGGVLTFFAGVATMVAGAAAVIKLTQFLKGLKVGGAGGSTVPGFNGPNSNGRDPMLDAQHDIAANTKETARNTAKQLDFRKYALGGGDRGRIGITPVEMFGGMRRASPNTVRVQFSERDALSKAIEDITNRAILALVRSGHLATPGN